MTEDEATLAMMLPFVAFMVFIGLILCMPTAVQVSVVQFYKSQLHDPLGLARRLVDCSNLLLHGIREAYFGYCGIRG